MSAGAVRRGQRPRHHVLILFVTVAVVLCLAVLGGSGRSLARAADLRHGASAHGASTASSAHQPVGKAHTVTYDNYSFKVDGQRVYLWSGEFHYFRLPSPDLWLDVFQKMKAAGFNTTSLYFDWGYHSPRPGVYDFTGVRDLNKLLDMAQQAGLYVIARPASYINAEVDGGGLPTWLETTKGNNRSADPNFLKWNDQWMTQIDRIIKRHQLTNGTGSVIAYQVENEYYNGSADGRAYMQHLENKARADGITVPLTGNNNGTFNSGTAALDVDGADSYPQGFNCSNPSQWSGVPDLSYDHPAGKPLYTAEFQGGAFDPWGGSGYDKCAQLINDQFADVFYENNIADGATAQSFYMTYGGTNWGWLGMPENYTSYDYGAAIRETRQLDPKYYEDKLLGYLTQAVTDLRMTDPLTANPPDDAAVIDTARINPQTHAQFHVIRHADSTSTSVDNTHISIDLSATGPTSYTYDDADTTDLHYSGSWQHVSAQSYTGGDYKNTESFSDTAGDSVTIPFTGTSIRWIGSLASNHGNADVYLDGVKQGTVDGYDASSVPQKVMFAKSGLTNGPHTLKIVVDGTHNPSSGGSFVSIDAIDLSVPPAALVVPQQPGTSITLNGRDSHILLANYAFGQQKLVYSTSELMTDATIGRHDVAVLYGDAGSDGETVLHYAARPTVTSTGGAVTTTWDAATGDLRLNYKHDGLIRIQICAGGTRPLLLLAADKPTAETFWEQDTAAGPVLVRGTHLLRTATVQGDTLLLTGDNASDNGLEVFTAAKKVYWNGQRVQTKASSTGSLVGVIGVAKPVTLPALTNWKEQDESPEAAQNFDDSSWVVADKTTSNSITPVATPPVLFADDYGFHTGNTWYRGHFIGNGKDKGVHLESPSGGGAQAFSGWLNGVFLGSSTTGTADLTFPAGSVHVGQDNVLSVLTVNMGHEEDYYANNGSKAARGLTVATIAGDPLAAITWRLQGVRGGENEIDPVRGPLSTGGLYGERAGWSLPGYPDASWKNVSLPTSQARAGVSWYRTTVNLNLPKGQDTSVGLQFTDDPTRMYRVILYVNGWQLGNYVNYLGPQHSFPIPNGILNPNGQNTIALAVWNLDGTTGGLGSVQLVNYGSVTSPLRVGMVNSPGYNRAKYAMPVAPGTSVHLSTPDTVGSGASFTATATVAVGPYGTPATDLMPALRVPSGWKVSSPSTTGGGSGSTLEPGQSVTYSWTVKAPVTIAAAPELTASIAYVQLGKKQTNSDSRVLRTVPAPPGSGSIAVSSLPFLVATNGWGPVERNMSVGGNQAGDGKTLTIDGVTYAKGLGTNSISDVEVYLGGRCTTFTTWVGVDDETGGGGTVTFAVQADGTTLVTTPVIKGHQPATQLSVNVTGAQVLDLIVGDGGDGNGNDHGDWAAPTLTCT